MNIGDFNIGIRPYVIAEIGNNHLGDPELAHRTLDAAVEAGVDAVKFQMFNPTQLVIAAETVLKHVPDKTYSTQRERFSRMCLDRDTFSSLARHAAARKVAFLCTPFDRESADFLNPLVPVFKIASGDATNYQLIDHVVDKGKPMLVSTGLCTQQEVDFLVKRLPKDRTLLFHCVGAYPTPDKDACLSLIPYYKSRYGIPIGYSDHTCDLIAPVGAVAVGALAIEKHFILDRSLPGGDRELSLTGPEMMRLVQDTRRVFEMLGDTPRSVRASEVYGREKLRRSPYTRRPVNAGEKLMADDIVFLRPAVDQAFAQEAVMAAKEIIAISDQPAETPLRPQHFRLL